VEGRLVYADEFEARLFGCTDVQSVADCVLDAGLRLTGASLGNVQLLDWKENHLTIAVHRGFDQEFLDFFHRVNADTPSICGRALKERRAIVIRDVMLDEGFAPYRAIAKHAGFRAVQSTPIISSSGALFGVVSTHFPMPYRPTEGEMNAVRSFTNLAANAIVRIRARPETIRHLNPVTNQNGFVWQPISSAPFDRDLELAVIDYHGTHALVFPCRRVLKGWINSETKKLIDGLRPTHWREWQAT
jgi:GAF domain-containing protein